MKSITNLHLGRATTRLVWTILCTAVTPPPLTAQQLPQQSLQQHLDAARLASVRDSFVVMLQGKASGWQRLTATRAGTEYQIGDAIVLDGFVQQASTVMLDAKLQHRSLRQEGVMRGAPMKIALDFADGRVKGTALTPAGGAAPMAIDTTVAPTTLDDNAITPLLAGVRWRDSLAFAFPVLASGKGTTDLWSVQVMGRDTTTVPAGHFETWRVEMKSGQSRSIVHVTRNAPFRVVRMQNGPAFEMQLVNGPR
jgi:hypothetical protein